MFPDDTARYVISIHALREEGDILHFGFMNLVKNFYPRPPRGGRRQLSNVPFAFERFLSTPSARRATDNIAVLFEALGISIHALREEGDSKNRDKISIFL